MNNLKNYDAMLDFSDVLIRPQLSSITSRADVNLISTKEMVLPDWTWKGIPIIAANMDSTGTFEVAAVLQTFQMMTCIRKRYTIIEWGAAHARYHFNPDYVIPSFGMDTSVENVCSWLDLLRRDTGFEPKWICLDVANGYMREFHHYVEQIAAREKQLSVIAGNVATADGALALADVGVHVVKIGLGNGSSCLTRRVTGVGVPQISALEDCIEALDSDSNGVYCISDGGCVEYGDIAKAFVMGADFVMLGGMLAGTDECAGKIIGDTMEFYGMASATALAKYGQEYYRVPEGRDCYIPMKGPIAMIAKNILGALQSTGSYIGAAALAEFPIHGELMRVNRQLNQSLASYDSIV